ncbi:glycosyl hydrolase family 31 [Tetragenococcus koreensis]|uniref:glycoside hydrolase family 31 protein n=1 Tax=Tetragenococcus koreensis TaxID=290335 RepID=UPI000F509ECB|nr:TIM-barrel domain-containing protein [Tetragenococcus koreensis]AYW46532.1 glycosyl hydrolase family 31 [Tetragenococcus koreensis]MCF1585356.1 glycosyl hydrolase family 31 [Tetragenococcus koreensis]MCF1619740.1 glycosyl hydrolase family 31 [Tetragenococcus koreensis]MCF1629591.1 glycosyl hydrolase family 31 [Tetragenococcus koreensis]MCF1657223.1 glycosyl hydrolase family 31 [Tetragenococcus koreensis]
MYFQKEIEITSNSIIVKDRDQFLIIKEWGENSVRVISAPDHNFSLSNKYGIEELEKNNDVKVSINKKEELVEMINYKLKIVYDGEKLVFYNKNHKILEEISRRQSNVRRTTGIDDHIPIKDLPTSSLNISPREFNFKSDNSYEAILRFEGDTSEKMFGLGGYQEGNLNKNFGTYELMHRNSQTSIPFYISNKNYGFIWNNSSIGEVTFSRNQIIWKSNNTQCIDYVVTVGDNPKQLLTNFTTMTGKPPKLDKDLLGLWQSKLRYQTLNEIKEIYNGYKKRKINLSVLVIDYFHWTADGDFEFDLKYWNGINQWANVLKANNIKLMVSLWPTVTSESKYYDYYKNNQMLIRSAYKKDNMFEGKEILDFSNPLTAKHLQKLLNHNYRELGVDLFWADQAEPEMTNYNHKEYLVYDGSLEKYGNKYPYHYIKAVKNNNLNVYDQTFPVLIRSAWFNSQKYGALAWSGDIESSFNSLKRQIQIGISMGLSGIPWWTSDIAGFHSGDSSTENFRELMIRWFQFAVFSPILRMHGDRQPHTIRIGENGGGLRTSGGPNEIWSFGKEVEEILTKFICIREKLAKYIETLYDESAKVGYPIIRSLFFEFPYDSETWNETTNYMFGSDLLIVPIVEEKTTKTEVYLPKGCNWTEVFSGISYEGGRNYEIIVSLDTLPVFCKEGSVLEKNIENIFKEK